MHRTLRPSGASLRRPSPSGVSASPASRGLAPREGLVLLMLKLSRTRPLMEPRGGPQAGRAGYPHILNADSSPQAPTCGACSWRFLHTAAYAPLQLPSLKRILPRLVLSPAIVASCCTTAASATHACRCYRRPGFGGIQFCLPAAHHVALSTAWYGQASAPTPRDPR